MQKRVFFDSKPSETDRRDTLVIYSALKYILRFMDLINLNVSKN